MHSQAGLANYLKNPENGLANYLKNPDNILKLSATLSQNSGQRRLLGADSGTLGTRFGSCQYRVGTAIERFAAYMSRGFGSSTCLRPQKYPKIISNSQPEFLTVSANRSRFGNPGRRGLRVSRTCHNPSNPSRIDLKHSRPLAASERQPPAKVEGDKKLQKTRRPGHWAGLAAGLVGLGCGLGWAGLVWAGWAGCVSGGLGMLRAIPDKIRRVPTYSDAFAVLEPQTCVVGTVASHREWTLSIPIPAASENFGRAPEKKHAGLLGLSWAGLGWAWGGWVGWAAGLAGPTRVARLLHKHCLKHSQHTLSFQKI